VEFTTLYKSGNMLATARLWSHIIIIVHIDIGMPPKVIQNPDTYDVELHEEEMVICKRVVVV
jgi:hypothetical protein